jgi:hypothetical protein
MVDDKELVKLVNRIYEEQNARYIKEEELVESLKKNGLVSEEVTKAIQLAMKQHVIRFCYPSSVGGKELVPCYERITEEDLLPPEIIEQMRKKSIQKGLRRMKKGKNQTK